MLLRIARAGYTPRRDLGGAVYWHLALVPTMAIALTMLGFAFLGDGLRDALDPKQQAR